MECTVYDRPTVTHRILQIYYYKLQSTSLLLNTNRFAPVFVSEHKKKWLFLNQKNIFNLYSTLQNKKLLPLNIIYMILKYKTLNLFFKNKYIFKIHPLMAVQLPFYQLPHKKSVFWFLTWHHHVWSICRGGLSAGHLHFYASNAKP